MITGSRLLSVCRNGEEQSPLKLEVVRELLGVSPGSALDRPQRLSIMSDLLETLKLYVELLKDDHRRLLVAAEEDFNQVLRLLVSLEELRAIANATNDNGHTAPGIIERTRDVMKKSTPGDLYGSGIRDILTRFVVRRGNVETKQSRIKRWYREILMVVAALIASISFQAAINPPGGTWLQDTIDNHNCTKPDMCRAGTAVLKDAEMFHHFYSNNNWAFAAGVVVLFLHFGGLPLRNKAGTWLISLTTCLMLYNALEAWLTSTIMLVTSNREKKTLVYVSYVWRFMLMLVVMIHTACIWCWLMFDKVTSIVRPGSMLRRSKPIRTVAFSVGIVATVSMLLIIFVASSRQSDFVWNCASGFCS